MIHNHEVPSSILGLATRKYSKTLYFFRLYRPLVAQRKIPVDISSMAIKTALFLAEILFRYTLAMKSIYFLAECSTKQAERALWV